MLSPRLTNCVDCTTIPVLLNNIDCKIAQLADNLYNNVVFMLNQPVPADVMIDLLNYRRILTFKYCNPDYAGCFTIPMIASKVKRLTINNKPVPRQTCGTITTTSSTTADPITTTTSTSSSTSTTTSTTTVVTGPTINANYSVTDCDTSGGFQTVTLINGTSICDANVYLSSNFIMLPTQFYITYQGSSRLFIKDGVSQLAYPQGDCVNCSTTSTTTTTSIISYNYTVSASSSSDRNYTCSNPYTSGQQTLWASTYVPGDVQKFYTDSNLTNPYLGNVNDYYAYMIGWPSGILYVGQMGADGTMFNKSVCEEPTTTTSTTTSSFNISIGVDVSTGCGSLTPINATINGVDICSSSTITSLGLPFSDYIGSPITYVSFFASDGSGNYVNVINPTAGEYVATILGACATCPTTTTTTTAMILPSVSFCGKIITSENSTLTVLNDGTPIPYASNITEWNDYTNSSTPCYTYWEFNPAEAYRGCLYNQVAINNLAPTGWRALTTGDVQDFYTCSPYQPSENLYAAYPGNWDLTFWTDQSHAGETGINFQGYGYPLWNNENILWNYDGRFESHGYSPSTYPYYGSVVSTVSGYISWGDNAGNTEKDPLYARFIKI